MASAAASSHYVAETSSSFNETMVPKFSEYRSQVMLGDLPTDFLRIQFPQSAMHDAQGFGMRPGHPSMGQQQPPYQNPNFLGYFTLTIAEAKLVKNAGLLGLIKMDPYVTFRIGHVLYDTPTATSGGKNPQWKASYRINLFKGMDKIHVEVYDQRNFTEDSFIGECEVPIPREVMQGETHQHWYPLLGRQPSGPENQGDILLIMSFVAMRPSNQPATASPTRTPVVNPDGHATMTDSATASSSTAHSSNPNETTPVHQHSPSAIPKPPPAPYSTDDVRTIEEMFPTTDRRTIIDLLDRNEGNKDLVVNHLLQNAL